MTSDEPIYVIGLDIGGTKTAGAVVAFPEGRIILRRQIATNAARDGIEVLEEIASFAERLEADARDATHHISGLGAGVAELVNPAGEVTSSQTIAWRGLPVRERLSQIAPAVIESDVRAAALGEALFGAGRGHQCFAYITIGTGISSTLVQGGQPWPGVRGNALVLATGPSTCWCTHCGQRTTSVVEEFSSGPALARRYVEITGRQGTRPEEVTVAAACGDETALDVVKSAGEAIGSSIGFLVNVLDPSAVVIGGGLGLCGGPYWDALVASTRRHIWADEAVNLPVVRAHLGPDSGVVGAAARWWQIEAAKKTTKENRT